MSFEIKSSIKLHDTDAAGVVFFVSHFRIAHTAYEEFLEERKKQIPRFMKMALKHKTLNLIQ